MLASPLFMMATLLALAATALADLTLTSPNATSWITAGGSLPVTWTYSGSYPATISIELVDNSKQLFTGPLALFSNLVTTSGTATWTVPKLGYVGNNFSIILVANIGGNAVILAQGANFTIKPEGSVAPAAQAGSGHSAAATTRWGASCMAVTVTAMILALSHLG